MSQNNNILISGASCDGPNRNAVLRTFVTEGFEDVLGADNVHQVALDYINEGLIKYQPSILLLFGSCMPDDISYHATKKICREQNILLVFWLHDDPYEFDYSYKVEEVADVIFSNDKWAALHYSHDDVFHMPLAASRKKHYQKVNGGHELDFFFCGIAFKNRVQLIHDLDSILRKYKTIILGEEWPDKSADYFENRTIQNDKLIDYYSSSKVVLNIGRHFNYSNNKYLLAPSTPGPRTFEAAMAGAVQFYFAESLEILDYYEDGKEIILFDTIRDFSQKIEMLVEDELALGAISQAAQQKTLNAHTYSHRAAEIMQILKEYL